MQATRENLTRAEATERAATVVAPSYHVVIDLTDEQQFAARTAVRFGATGASTFIDLTALRVTRCELNGVEIGGDAFTGTRLQLGDLADSNELVIESTHEYSNEGMGLHRFVDPVDGHVYLHTQHEPFDAHRTFACFDQPDIKGTFAFEVLAPDEWVVVSNTEGVSEPADGGPTRWRFPATARISTYLTAIVAGHYHAHHEDHEGTSLGLYCRSSLAEFLDPGELLDVTRRGLDFFAEAFGHPYPFGKYDQLFVPEFSSGAMENPGCITFNEAHIFRSKVTDAARENRADTILHEMAHMWFGDLVTMRWWDDLWLNESFASYMAAHSQSQATRWTDSWVTFSDRWKAWAKHEDQLPTTHPIEPDVPDVESVHQNFDGITYAKGASVLRQLAAWVGDEAFFEGCRSYFERYAYDNATLRDFLAELEAASGRDLSAWTDQWLRTAGLNTLRAEPSIEGDVLTGLDIVQSAPDGLPTLRDHRLGVGLYDITDDGLTLRRREELDARGASTSIAALVGERAPDLILLNDGDLTYAKLELDPRSRATAATHLRYLSDPLARALLWGAAWDMVRDATMPAGEYLTWVHTNAPGEGQISVLSTLLRRAHGAVMLYGDPAVREERLDLMSDYARKAAESAGPGSDEQLVWVRHWADCARGDRTGGVADLVDGRLTFEGLTVDTELRWHLTRALAAAGAADDARIDAEAEADPTDIGLRYAAAARAARPDADAKAAAWERMLEGTDLSHTMVFAIARAFPQIDQPPVLEPFIARYFDVLPTVWAERNLDWAIDFSRSLFPHWSPDTVLLERVALTLQDEGLPRPLRRVLIEERDTVERAMAARARDAQG